MASGLKSFFETCYIPKEVGNIVLDVIVQYCNTSTRGPCSWRPTLIFNWIIHYTKQRTLFWAVGKVHYLSYIKQIGYWRLTDIATCHTLSRKLGMTLTRHVSLPEDSWPFWTTAVRLTTSGASSSVSASEGYQKMILLFWASVIYFKGTTTEQFTVNVFNEDLSFTLIRQF